MTEESVALEPAPRRSGLMLLLTRTPYSDLLRGCTANEFRAAVSAAVVPRQFRVRVRDDLLTLRKYGGAAPLATGWAVKARLEETVDGVRLTGHQCYLSDRLYFAFFAIFTILLLGVALWIALDEGPGAGGVVGCLVVAMLPGLLALLIVTLQPTMVARQEGRAREMLRGILEAR
jgi:hypothetical protein